MNRRTDPHMPYAAWLLLAALCILLLPWLGETLFNSKGEPREAIVAVSILDSGNWILPTNYGSDIPFKPPFLAWLISIAAILFNGGEVSEYISRLPSALALIAMTMGGYFWARRERGVRFAMVFALVSATCVETYRAGIACRLDMVLTACMVGALYIMYGLTRPDGRFKWVHWLAAWALLSAAALTKGPVGSLLPCFAMGIYMLLIRKPFFPTLAKMLSLALAALIPLAWWFWLAWQQGGDHFYDLMMEENIGRLIGTMSYDSHVQPFYYNFLTILAGMLPYTLLALISVLAWRRRERTPLQPAGLFCITVALTVIIFYCIPESKRSVYLLPAYPAMAYGIAFILCSPAAARPVRIFAWLMAIIAIVAPICVIALQIWHLKGLTIDSLKWWNYLLLALPIAIGVAWMSNRHSPVGHTLVAVWALLLCYGGAIAPAILNPRSDYKAVERLTADPDARIFSLEYFYNHRLFTLNYYLHDRIRPIGSFEAASFYPPGTMLLVSSRTDTLGLSTHFDYEPLLDRSCDHRETIGLAIRRREAPQY